MKNPRYLVGIFLAVLLMLVACGWAWLGAYKPSLFVGVNLIDDVTVR